MKLTIITAAMAILFLLPLALGAQDAGKDSTTAPASTNDPAKGDRLFFSLMTGLNFTLNDNRDVVGQTSGTAFSIGSTLNTRLEYYKLNHELRTGLLIDEQFSYTPDLDRLVKSADKFAFDIIYLYNIHENLWGPFAKFLFETQLFNGFLNTAVPEPYLLPDGTTVESFDQFQTSGSFDPIKMSESIGLFVKPWTRDWLKIEFRAGLGALHVIANEVYVKGDKNALGQIPLTKVESFNQLGAAFAASFTGAYKLYAPVTYGATADILVPFVYDDPQDRNAGELTNYNFGANLTADVASWLAVGYRLSVVRQPQVSEDWQIQNNLVVTFRFSFEKEVKEETAEPTPAPAAAPAPAAEPAPAPAAEPAPAPAAEPAPAPAPAAEPTPAPAEPAPAEEAPVAQ